MHKKKMGGGGGQVRGKRKVESAPNATRSVSTTRPSHFALKMNSGVKHFNVLQRLQFNAYAVLFTF